MKLNIAFFGSPAFSLPVLNILHSFNPISLVISSLNESKNAPSQVTLRSRHLNIDVLTPKIPTKQTFNRFRSWDLFVIAAYGQILCKEVLSIPRLGVLNIHPSLLPKYRGASPIQSAILNREKETGSSIILADDKIDHGPLIARRPMQIYPDETGITLSERLSKISADLLQDILPSYIEGNIHPAEQDHSKATYTKLLLRNDGKINWGRNAEDIDSQIRAYLLWPSSWTMLGSMRVKILSVSIGKNIDNAIPKGSIEHKNGNLMVAARDKYIIVNILQPEGRKQMSGAEFIRGYIKNLSSASFGS